MAILRTVDLIQWREGQKGRPRVQVEDFWVSPVRDGKGLN